MYVGWDLFTIYNNHFYHREGVYYLLFNLSEHHNLLSKIYIQNRISSSPPKQQSTTSPPARLKTYFASIYISFSWDMRENPFVRGSWGVLNIYYNISIFTRPTLRRKINKRELSPASHILGTLTIKMKFRNN